MGMKCKWKLRTLTAVILNFRMALNKKILNVTCNLNGYLFCRMPEDTLEVEVKVKTKWEKHTLFQDTYTQTEKYCSWDRADKRSNVCTRRRRTPKREVHSSHDNTTSETDIPVGEGFGYPHRSSQTLNLQLRFPTQKRKKRYIIL